MSDTQTTIQLHPYDADSPLLEDALAVYARVWPARSRDEARENFTRYARYPDFHGFVATVNGEAAGVGYGARSQRGVWWHDRAAAQLGWDHPGLQDAWRLVELAVVEEHRRAGIGGLLHDALLAAQQCRRALICTATSNATARAMYERRGWYYIAEAFNFPSEPHPYAIMGREMGSANI